jgi:predicted RNase H-like HicB family nuclease
VTSAEPYTTEIEVSRLNAIIECMRILNYEVVMTPDETGGYVVTCPALPGLVTEGDTLEEACEMAADAISCYLESLNTDGLPIPTDE